MVVVNTFGEWLREVQTSQRSLLCVGLDPDPSRFPAAIGNTPSAITEFNRAIIEATSDIAICYKPNLGFYLAHGATGIEALVQIRRDVPAHIPVILDAKVGDVDTTTTAYAQAYFDTWGFSAVTAHPYIGRDGLQPLLDYRGKGVFVLTKTSNPGAGMLQDRVLAASDASKSECVSQFVARHANSWNEHGNVGLVAGATYPDDLKQIRNAAPELPILVPGIGMQRGNPEDVVRAGIDARGAGLVINASRSISYASSGSDFQDAARAVALQIRDQIEAARAMAPARG